jgi:tetrapyrrole methylase family protein/MazG family protein
MIDFPKKDQYGFEDLVQLIAVLRAPGGCPWDGEQTHQSIRRNFIEETYEVCEAIDEDDPVHMCEELGDVLTQVVFHADIEREAGRFTLDDVCDGVCKKLILRHPHVFGTVQADTTEQVLTNWDEIKRKEKHQATYTDTLRAVAVSLPSLWRADKLIGKSEKAGFAWHDAAGALDKLSEEVEELRRAASGDGDVSEELGDVLFAAVCAGRYFSVDPEDALTRTCEKFIRRFSYIEQAAQQSGRSLEELTPEEQGKLWNESKLDPAVG